MELAWGDDCFVCGADNPAGLRLQFSVDEAARTITTRWTPDPVYQGYRGILHGGILSTLLDEAVGKLSTSLAMPGVTAELNVRFLRPVPTGRPLQIHGQLTKVTSKLLLGEAQALLEDGQVAARATVKLVRKGP